MKPRKSILDPTFEYVNADRTDIRKRFNEIRRERKRIRNIGEADAAEVIAIFEQRRDKK